MSSEFSFLNSIPIVKYEKKRWKARLADNVYMIMDIVGTQQEYCVLQFVDDDDDYLDVPTCFSLSTLTTMGDEDNYKIVPIFPGHQFYILLFANSYEFRYAGNTSSLNRIERWFGAGDHIWYESNR